MTPKRPFMLGLIGLLSFIAAGGCSRVENGPVSRGGIQQVGLVWLKDKGDPGSRAKVVNAVHNFGRHIPDVQSAVVGLGDGQGGGYVDGTFDVCFILTFADEVARQRYISIQSTPRRQRRSSFRFRASYCFTGLAHSSFGCLGGAPEGCEDLHDRMLRSVKRADLKIGGPSGALTL